MNRVQARTEMQRVLGDAASLLTSADEEAALDSARVPDPMGRTPDADGYIETIDPWLAAADAADVLAIRALGSQGMLGFTSEGATFQWKAADFSAMASALRSKAAGRGVGLSVISVDTGGPQGGAGAAGDGYWTWDADVPRWYPWRLP